MYQTNIGKKELELRETDLELIFGWAKELELICQCKKELRSCRPTHTCQICLCVINIVEIGEGVSFFFTFLQFVHKINIYMVAHSSLAMATKLVTCNT